MAPHREEWMRPPRNNPWWSSCMLSSARHFSLGKRHFLLGFRHFSLGWCVCNSLCHNGLREMSFPNRLNNRLKKSIGDYAMLRPYASWKMDWKVVERWLGECVSSLLGDENTLCRYVPRSPTRREGKIMKSPPQWPWWRYYGRLDISNAARN